MQRRRDRAKTAQRNFRRRQAEKTLDLNKSHKRMEKLLEQIVRAHAVDDGAALDLAVAEARTLVDVGEPQQRGDAPRNLPEPLNPVTSDRIDVNTTDNDDGIAGRFSPRLSYGLLMPEKVKITTAPVDIRQYIGPARHTVAGCIMWTCLDYAVTIMKQTGGEPVKGTSPRDLQPQSPAHQLFKGALSHSKPLHDIAYIMDLIEARIEFRDRGYMRSDCRGADEVSRRILETSVHDELRCRGVKMDQWWTALEIEAYIWDLVTGFGYRPLQKALEISIESVVPLAKALASRAVCFGNGPRWNQNHVTEFTRVWAQTVNEALSQR
jgi:hypothetical protein